MSLRNGLLAVAAAACTGLVLWSRGASAHKRSGGKDAASSKSEHESVKFNVDRFTDLAHIYHDVRPSVPAALTDMLIQLWSSGTSSDAARRTPSLVVDLACGTGLSTVAWLGRCTALVGVEPNAQMRATAEKTVQAHLAALQHAKAPSVRIVEGDSTHLPIEAGTADIIAVSQALHWMEPQATFQAVHRALRTGGLFAAIDNDWPPVLHWRAQHAYDTAADKCKAIGDSLGTSAGVVKWPKERHLHNLRESKLFRYTHEFVMHSSGTMTADRLLRILLSQGGISQLLRSGRVTQEQIGIEALRTELRELMGANEWPCVWGYRVRIGIK